MAASVSAKGKEVEELNAYVSEEEEEEDDDGDKLEEWDDWYTKFKCLFCESIFSSSNSVFEHCAEIHDFDFQCIRKSLGLDFVGASKLINYVREKAAAHRSWNCGYSCDSSDHCKSNKEVLKALWKDGRYLTPFMEDDSILYFLSDDEEESNVDESIISADKEELLENLRSIELVEIEDDVVQDLHPKEDASICNGSSIVAISSSNAIVNDGSPNKRETGSHQVIPLL